MDASFIHYVRENVTSQCICQIFQQCHQISWCSLLHLLDPAARLQMERDQEEKKKPSNDQSEQLIRLASVCEGQAFWLFEGRIGWGSCKLPNNPSARRCTALDVTMFPVYLDHAAAFDADPSPDWVTSWNSALVIQSWYQAHANTRAEIRRIPFEKYLIHAQAAT